MGNAIAISNSDTINVNISIGPTVGENNNYNVKRHKNESIWSVPEYINENNDSRNRQMFIDNDNNLHLFENHWEETASMIYSTRKNNTWNTEIIMNTPDYSYEHTVTSFHHKNEFYLVYRKISHATLNTLIYYMTKKIDVGIENSEGTGFITGYELIQNYPNPFNNETVIKYLLYEICKVELSVYNSKGELIDNLINKKQSKGRHKISFNAGNLNSGIYYYQLIIGGKVKEIRKMLYLR